MINFAGEEVYENNRNEFLELFLNCDYSKVNALKETILKKLKIQTKSQKSFQRMTEILKPIIEERIKNNLKKQDILDSCISEVINNHNEYDDQFFYIVNIMMFNMFIAGIFFH
jgi:ATP-dependent DNA ligase